MAVKVIERLGKKILCVDFRGMQDQDEMLGLVSKLEEEIVLYKSPFLLLVHCEDAFFGQAVNDRILQNGKEFTDKDLISKMAVLGMGGIKSILLQNFLVFTKSKATRAFVTEAEAIRWLVSD